VPILSSAADCWLSRLAEDEEAEMRTTTNRIRLRIDLALAQLDEPPSAEGIPSRRQLLAPPAPARPSDRSRPILLAPGRDLTRASSTATPGS
jgi:hypothetical protein